MRRFALLGLAVASLILPASATAAPTGCWATVRLSSVPNGLAAGEPWAVRITVLQHGRTPLRGAQPAVTIRDGAGVATRFRARPTAVIGRYSARVVFPAAGTWRFEVFDGFVPSCAQTHRYPVVEIVA